MDGPPKPQAWYDDNPAKQLKDQTYAEGFGLSLKELTRLKSKVKGARDIINPRNLSYKGNSWELKKEHADEFVRRWPEFGRPPDPWRTHAICAFMNRLDASGTPKQKGKADGTAAYAPTVDPRATVEPATRWPTVGLVQRTSTPLPSEPEYPLPPSDGLPLNNVLLRFATFEDGIEEIHSEVSAEELCDLPNPKPSCKGFCKEARALDGFGFQGRVYMPERDNGGVPISTEGALRTAINQVRMLRMRSVLVTPVDQPTLRHKLADNRKRANSEDGGNRNAKKPKPQPGAGEKSTDLPAQGAGGGTLNPSGFRVPTGTATTEAETSL